MRRRMSRPRRRPLSSRRRSGSALVLTLMLTAVLLVSVTAMLYAVRHTSRSTSDKFAYEECYHAATAGLQMVSAWLLRPQLAASHLGEEVGTAVQGITSGTVDLSTAVILSNYSLAGMSPERMLDYYNGAYNFTAEGTRLDDGRRVIYTFPDTAGRIIVFQNDALANQTASLFDPAAENVRSYVSRLRITTPYPAGASGSTAAGLWAGEELGLRRVSLIVEAEAVTLSAGTEKRRLVQQKLLVYPPVEGSPPLSMGHAIISGAGVQVKGSSSLNVHWGPVMVTGDIDLLDIGPLDTNAKKLHAAGKFFGAGVGDEHWLKWAASGLIYHKNGGNRTPVFPDTINGVEVRDFFVQVLNGQFGENWFPDRITLTGYYNQPLMTQLVNTNNNSMPDLYAPPNNGVYTEGTGAFVQKSPAVAEQVDAMIWNTLDYATWKQFAIKKNGYLRPTVSGGSVSGYVNAEGQKLYVTPSRTLTTSPTGNTPMTNLAQLSMKPLVPASGNTADIADRILFVDTPEGTPDGTKRTITLGSNDDFFWKGLLYLNASLSTSGGGAFPTILGKNPDDYRADPVGTSTGTLIPGCYLDGALMVTGQMSRTGNAAIYGTLIATGGYGGSGGPDIYYNSRNAQGLFRGQGTHVATFQIIEGPTAELNSWPAGTQ